MEELRKLFKEIGYTEEEIEYITSSYALKRLRKETLLNNVKRNYEFLISLGYSKEEVLKITKTLTAIYGYSVENMEQKMKDIEEIGYNREEVLKMIKRCPAIYSFSKENMQQKVKDIEELGYSREEVLKMTKDCSAIFSLSIENMKQKIKDIEALGYTREEVISMTSNLPTIYGLSIETIKEKIKFYDSIGLHSLVVIDSKKLMQSVALSYARYMFYKEKGISINEKNYSNLFMGQKPFEKKYKRKKSELIEKYNYKAYLQEKSTKELVKESESIFNEASYIEETEGYIIENEDIEEKDTQNKDDYE